MRYFVLLLPLLLAACGQGKTVEPFNLNGRWAWSTTQNCTNDANVMVINGQRLIVKLRNRQLSDIENLNWILTGEGEARRLNMYYSLSGHRHEDRFRIINTNLLILDRLLVDGRSPDNVERALGRSLYRCAV
jgi:hypothetical protein